MAKEKVSALKLGFAITFLYVIMTSIIFSALGVYFSVRDAKQDSQYIQKLYAQNVVGVLKGKVDGVIRYINMERNFEQKKLSEHLEEQVGRIYRVIYELYLKESNEGKKKSLIKKDLLDIAGVFYKKKKGECFFIFDKQGKVLFGGKNELPLIQKLLKFEGVKGNKRNIVLTEFKRHKKMIYVVYFPPMDWYMAYCSDLTYLDKKVKNCVIEYLNNYRYGYKKHGYIFVAKLLLNRKPSCRLMPVVNPNRPEIVGKCQSINTPDAKGFYYRKKYVHDILTKGYSITEYYYKIPGTGKFGKKISYMAYYKPWNWIIGTGYYIKDIGSQFYNEKMKNVWKTAEKVLLAVLLVLSLLSLIFFVFFGRLKPEIGRIVDFLEKFPMSDFIDIKDFRFEELSFIAEKINEMAKNVRKLTEEQKEIITLYTSITNFMNSCVVIVERKGNDILIKDINGCVQKCMGIKSKDEVVGKEASSFFRELPYILDKIERVLEDGITIEAVDIVKNMKGCGFMRYFQSEVFKISENEAVYIADDITDSVMLYYRSLIEQERLSSLIEDLDIGVVVVNHSGKVMFANSMVKDIFEVYDREVHSLEDFIVGEDIRERVNSYFYGIINNDIKCESCVFEIKTFKGNKKWIEITATKDTINNEPVVVISVKDITYKYLKEKEIEYLSLHDDLTGLYNRRFFREELHRLFNPRSYPLVLAIFDINGLKMVNDILGHRWGDWLIKKVAEILKNSVRAVDIVARIGGDEFVLLMPNTDEKGAKMCIERIKANIDKENSKDGQPYISVSIGYEVQRGQYDDPDKFFAAADRAMYKEKYTEKRKDELKKIWQTLKEMRPDSSKLHSLEEFIKR